MFTIRIRSNKLDVDVVELRAQAASMPVSNNNVNSHYILLISM